MSRDLYQRASRILSESLTLSPRDREVFVRAQCGQDQALLTEALSLLAHMPSGDGSNLPPLEFPSARIGDSLRTSQGDYTLLDLLGSGAMGLVYRARQERPVTRDVAIKVLKNPLGTQSLRTRFERECQALATMDHPHIAKIFDAGTTSSGQPYFVMELVRGTRVTEYADRERLDIRARLALFVAICRAVHHAHERGILHRDLKPDNILVSNLDGTPSPSIVDFGIAKAVGGAAPAETAHTISGFPMGTPGYMSPEQTVSAETIDRTTDVYALGALLYELLVGTPPFMVSRAHPLDEVLRAIRSTDPPRPSVRLSTTKTDATTVFASRRVSPTELRAALRADLDWIAMRALERDPRRRYSSANEMALDVERHLRGEPIKARPPTAVYHASKFVRRRRATLMSVAAVILAVAGTATVVLTVGATRLRTALTGRDPAITATSTLAEQSLDFGVKAYERRDFETARACFRDAIGYDSTLAMAYYHWSQCEAFWENSTEARRLSEKAFEQAATVDRDTRDFIESWYYLMTDRPGDAVLVLQDRVSRHPRDADAWYQLGRMYFANTDDIAAAIRCYRKTIDLRPRAEAAMNDLAYCYLQTDQLDSAIAWGHRNIALQPDLPNPYDTMGDILHAASPESAMVYYRLAIAKKSDFVVPLEKLANLALAMGQFEYAESLCVRMINSDDSTYRGKGRWYRAALTIYRGKLHEAEDEIATAIEEDRKDGVLRHVAESQLTLRAWLRDELGDRDGALSDLEEAIRFASSGRHSSPDQLRLMRTWVLLNAGRVNEARTLAESLAVAKHDNPRWDYTGHAAVALVALQDGQCRAAIDLLSEVIGLGRTGALELRYLRAEAFTCVGNHVRAIEDFEAIVGSTAGAIGYGPIMVIRAWGKLGSLYEAVGETEKARAAYARILSWWGTRADHSPIVENARRRLAALGQRS